MPTQKLFKRRVRDRMAKTGEHYTTARGHVARARDRVNADAPNLESAIEIASDERLREATGRGWQEWVAVLDEWGARDRTHPETASHLRTELGVPGWWAQTVTVGYQRARGMRRKHQQSDGFTVYASKTVGVSLDALYAAFVDEARRAQWLTDGSMSLRASQPEKVARFDWADGVTRVMVTFEAKGPAKATAHVTHERLAGPADGELAKSAWKQRLIGLKAILESTDV